MSSVKDPAGNPPYPIGLVTGVGIWRYSVGVSSPGSGPQLCKSGSIQVPWPGPAVGGLGSANDAPHGQTHTRAHTPRVHSHTATASGWLLFGVALRRLWR